jgi:hypothetical protein
MSQCRPFAIQLNFSIFITISPVCSPATLPHPTPFCSCYYCYRICSITLCSTQKITETRIPIVANFGMMNTKMTLKIENWLWFPSYGRDLIRMSYCSADD